MADLQWMTYFEGIGLFSWEVTFRDSNGYTVVQYVTSWMLERGTKAGGIATRTNMWRFKIGIVGPEPMSVGG